jgi:hypothetical protein
MATGSIYIFGKAICLSELVSTFLIVALPIGTVYKALSISESEFMIVPPFDCFRLGVTSPTLRLLLSFYLKEAFLNILKPYL